MTKPYYAVIADVIASRYLPAPTRRRLQAELREAIPQLNARFAKGLVGRFAITLGDEVQCLLETPKSIWEIAHAIRYSFRRLDWIVASGRGPLSTPTHPGATAPELDGPCFHEARAALERAKAARLVFAFGGFDDDRLTALASYYSALYWSWTARQRQAANDWRWFWQPIEASLTPTPTARPKVLPSAISHLRRRMAWPLVEAADRIFRQLLDAL